MPGKRHSPEQILRKLREKVRLLLDQPDGSEKVWWSIDGNNGLGGMSTVELPLYGSERLTAKDTEVVITEGEKAADALLDRLIIAVGTVTGASHTPFKKQPHKIADRSQWIIVCFG